MATNDDIKQELAEMKKEQTEMRSQISTLVEELRGLNTNLGRREQPPNPQQQQHHLNAIPSSSVVVPVQADLYDDRRLLLQEELKEIKAKSFFSMDFMYHSDTDTIAFDYSSNYSLGKHGCIKKTGIYTTPLSGRYRFHFNVESHYVNGSKSDWYLCWKDDNGDNDNDDDDNVKKEDESGKQFLCAVVPEEARTKKDRYLVLECARGVRVWLQAVLVQKGGEGKGIYNDVDGKFCGEIME